MKTTIKFFSTIILFIAISFSTVFADGEQSNGSKNESDQTTSTLCGEQGNGAKNCQTDDGSGYTESTDDYENDILDYIRNFLAELFG